MAALFSSAARQVAAARFNTTAATRPAAVIRTPAAPRADRVPADARKASQKEKKEAEKAARAAGRIAKKELRASRHALKRKLVQGEMAGLFDFVSQGFSVVKDLAPAAIKANLQSKIAASQAKSVQRVTDAQTAAYAAQERAATAASQVQQAQPVAPAITMDWQKPAMIGGGLLAAALILPRLIPQARR